MAENSITATREGLIAEIQRRVDDKILEQTNAELLIKLIRGADTLDEAMAIAQLGTTYKRTGLHYDKRLEKQRGNTIKYFKKNKELSFTDGTDSPHHKLIIGDNYDALQNLLIQYRGKVDVIYIDPPYGKDSMGEFANTNYDNAITRDNLLSMLHPRLMLAKQLLSNTGIIFCSIDDRNQSYVKCLLDEVFGESAFLFNVPRQTIKGGKTTTSIYKNHDYVLAYSMNMEIQLALLDTDTSSYNLEDEFVETRGKYKVTQTLDYDSLSYSATMDYVLNYEGKCFVAGGDREKREKRINGNHAKQDWTWRWSESDIQWAAENKLLVLKGNRIYTKTYEKCRKRIGRAELQFFTKKQQAYSSLMYVENDFSNNIGKKDLNSVIPGANGFFKNPKPISLIKALIDLVLSNEDAIVLDFFAGSGTTGQAILERNKEGNKAMFILCQINEITNETPNGIAYDVTTKRIKRVMTGTCYDGTSDFKWLKNNQPYGGNLDVYEIDSVSNAEHVCGKTPFDVIDETLYGHEKFTTLEDKIRWVCENFEITQDKLVEKK
ncbi:site-specific DNA-methyltransferase [Sodaliphilus sp.]|uniref:site-specific DNA-methyltransferase n=1 Tax=Sodaliphilus sp. TaxID=2815818 RepID=UPI00388CF2D3